METTKEWTEERIVALLESSPLAVERALVALYDRQTQDEKRDSDTRHDNQRGFSAAHAATCSYFARLVLRGWQSCGHRKSTHLYPDKLAKALKIVKRYRRQLAEIANQASVKRGGQEG